MTTAPRPLGEAHLVDRELDTRQTNRPTDIRWAVFCFTCRCDAYFAALAPHVFAARSNPYRNEEIASGGRPPPSQ